MSIIEVIAETTDHIGVNKAAKGPSKDPNKGKGDNSTLPMEAITITIIVVIIEAEVTVEDQAVIEAITITNTINFTHMMMVHRWSNMAHHAHFVEVLIIFPNTVLKESMTSTISWRKLALDPAINIRMVYINKGEHDNPHELPKDNSEGSLKVDNAVYTHTESANKLPEQIEKLEYIYQHDCEKIHEINPHLPIEQSDDTVYPQINNDIKYVSFENIIDSYYLDSQIRDDFTCTKACYTHGLEITT